jgi:Flp pilus assembly protein TadG
MRNCRTNLRSNTRPAARSNPRPLRGITERRCRGSVTVEMALVLPIVLLFILGVFEYGRYLMTVQIFNNAAREGARYAIAHLQPVTINGVTYGNATSDVTGKVTGVTGGVTLASQNINVYASDSLGNNVGAWTAAQAGQSVTVQVTGNYQVAVTAFLNLPSTIPVNIRATMDAEAN